MWFATGSMVNKINLMGNMEIIISIADSNGNRFGDDGVGETSLDG